ncbi:MULTISPECIES: type VII secretion protein [unclassified Streptomyces]|uniref:type VII secretion protein n=1 Tax=unclassified Streptomyces TaxID=2593676 RepID=UPI003827554E
MAVGEDWQRDVLRELNAGGPAEPDARPDARPDAGDSEELAGQPYAGPAEGTFRIPRAEPRGASASREPRTGLPASGVDAPGTASADPRQVPPSQEPAGPVETGPHRDAPGTAGTDPHQPPSPRLDAVAAARAAAQYGPGAPDARPATLPELRMPGGQAAVPMATPESVPTVDPRLAVALGKAVHGDPVTKRAGRSVRKLTSSAAQDVAEETRIGRELQQPVTTGRVIAVTSIRGGVGKTTVAALLARSFNHYRHDPVLALEADGALGTLPVRLGAESVRWSCADLAHILTPAMQLTDVTGYLVPVADGGWLLPASQGRLGAPLSMRTYRTVTLALRRYFAVTVVDCETLPGEVARTAMDTAHARIVVAPMTAEGVGATRVVLDWLGHLPHSALATTVVALTANSPDMTLDLKAATAHLREAGVTVLPVPYDRHLAQGGPIQTALLGRATRQAAVSLAAEAMERAVRVR